jgi:hypothetical protein
MSYTAITSEQFGSACTDHPGKAERKCQPTNDSFHVHHISPINSLPGADC